MSLEKFHPYSVFITGANRGIGLELVKQFLDIPNPPHHVFATYRTVEKAQDLHGIATKNSIVTPIQFDVTDYKSLPEVIKQVEAAAEGAGINLLINNAGIFKKPDLGEVTAEDMRELFETNTVAPLMITQAFLPMMKKTAATSTVEGFSCNKAAIINMSSRVGSCDDNESGGYYPYRTSKAALNMVTKNCAVDLLPHGIMSVAVHPGWVLTHLGGPNALITTEQCVEGLFNVMAGLEEKDTGTFLDIKGDEIPW